MIKSLLRVAGTIALLLAVYYLLQVLLLNVSIAVAALLNGFPLENMGSLQDAQFLKDNPAIASWMVNAEAVGLFLSVSAMLIFLHFTGYYRLRPGLLRSLAPKPLLLSTLLVFTSMFALNIFVQWFPLKDNLSDMFAGLSRNPLGVFTLAFLAPLLEEVFFRGAIQGVLMRFFGRPWPAIIVAALVFGVFHMNPVQVVYATLLGMVLGWIYYRTGSLMSVIVGHVLNNSLAVLTTVAFSAADEQAVANSSAGIAGFVFFAALSVYLALKLKAASKREQSTSLLDAMPSGSRFKRTKCD